MKIAMITSFLTVTEQCLQRLKDFSAFSCCPVSEELEAHKKAGIEQHQDR